MRGMKPIPDVTPPAVITERSETPPGRFAHCPDQRQQNRYRPNEWLCDAKEYDPARHLKRD